MKGSNFTRLARVAGYLFKKPGRISDYLKYSVSKKEPLSFELPWFSFEAIDFLNKMDLKNPKILELGGGGSTAFFGKKGALVTCLESSEIWADKLIVKTKELNLNNIHVIVYSYSANLTEEQFKETNYFKAITNAGDKFDIIVVDNYEESIEYRPACFYAAEKAVKEGGIIVLDDSWRYENVRKNNSAKKHLIFKSPGPCRFGVTSTDIFIY
jgi:predicted O-methyltransferase YrrM